LVTDDCRRIGYQILEAAATYAALQVKARLAAVFEKRKRIAGNES
jgi:hypothetical protein